MTTWRTVHGDAVPASPDTTSSAYTVYLRRNVQQETIEIDGETHTGYVYEEMTYSKKEWDELHSPAQVERMQKLNDIELAVAMI